MYIFIYVWIWERLTAWKVSKYGVISGRYFSVFGLNIGKYGPEITPYLDTFHAVTHVSSFMSMARSSRRDVLCKKCVLRKFEKFTGKHLCRSLFFNKVAGLFAWLCFPEFRFANVGNLIFCWSQINFFKNTKNSAKTFNLLYNSSVTYRNVHSNLGLFLLNLLSMEKLITLQPVKNDRPEILKSVGVY